MSDQLNQDVSSQQPAQPETGAENKPGADPAFRAGAVLKIVLPVALILGGGFVFFGFFDGAERIAAWMRPSRAAVSGVVFFNGEPLANAEIATRPVNSKLRGAIGMADAQGRFKLKTELGGEFLEGAYVGEHVVTAIGRQSGVFFGASPLSTPEQYASFETSPLRMTVVAGTNDVQLNLEGEPSATVEPLPPEGISQRPPGAGGGGGPQQPGGGPRGRQSDDQPSTESDDPGAEASEKSEAPGEQPAPEAEPADSPGAAPEESPADSAPSA